MKIQDKKSLNYCIVVPKLTQISEQSYSFPIGIAYVSASLKAAGYSVTTFNLNYKEGSILELLTPVIQDNEIDVLATGGLTAQYWQIKEIIETAKKIKPTIVTCVGGGLITSEPEAAMEALEVADYGVVGEGEVTICELAQMLEGQLEIGNINGLIYKNRNNKWTRTLPRQEVDNLDILPYPDYEAMEFANVLDKLPTDIYALNQGRFGFVSFGRSCPFSCTFCFHPSGTKYRKRSINSVFQEIDYLIDKFGIRNIAITDELFVQRIEDVKDFCKKIKARNIGFVISLRVDMVNKEMLQLLKDAGCLSVGFGLESADNRILESMRKHITVEQIDYALALCNKIGLNAMGNFIFGDQAETVETYHNTLKWWKEHPQYLIALHLIVLYPGSALYQLACERGLIKDKVEFIKNGCPYVNVSKLTDAEYREMALEISMLSQGRTELLENAKVKYIGFGKATLEANCPCCGEKQSWSGLDVFRSLGNVICESCNHVMNVMVADYIGVTAKENFGKLANHKIGIWPVMSAVAELCAVVPQILESENVYFIDSSKTKQGLQYHGKTIYSPQVIQEQEIEIVFLTVTTSIATEIINDLKNKYPSVKKILFAGDLIKINA